MKMNLPYASLRTFESVARLRGFGRAAEELGVSQSAVSQHVKALEKWLGARLVRRGGGVVVPTEQGMRLALAVGEGFGVVAALCDDLRAATGQRPALMLACPAALARLWLVPRLAEFEALCPAAPLQIVNLRRGGALVDDDADLTIHFGAAPVPGVHCERLMPEQVIPVCAPDLLTRGTPLTRPEDLAAHRLLHQRPCGDGSDAPGWHDWARQSGIALPQPLQDQHFDGAETAISAAMAGLGVALGRRPLVDAALAAGGLVAPFGQPVASGFGYWLAFSQGSERSARVRKLAGWLQSLAAAATDLPKPAGQKA